MATRKIIRENDLSPITGYSRTTHWRKSRDPDDDFPAPVQLGPNSTGWYEDEIENWLARRPRVTWAPDKTSRLVSPNTTDGGEAGS
jgi:predicted DNA-binding transcriptional regulator AlpA